MALFIEVFSFFFLKLYRSALQDIKYFQNELTNLEARATALEAALVLGDPEAIKGVITSLAQTERNFILKKGESTAAIEQAKADGRGLRDAATLAGKAMDHLRSKSSK